MVSFPPCKINLGLHVVSKRPDGYHNIETCFYAVPWTDVLEIIPAGVSSFSTSGVPIPGGDNLCNKAYALLKKDFDIPAVKIHLHKIIPIGAGLGGGSADAAYTLKMLNKIFDLALTTERLQAYAAQLGSDCAFFVHDSPMLGSGRGEILSPLAVNLRGKFLTIVNPNIHISTAEAYGGITPVTPSLPLHKILKDDVAAWMTLLKNDFERSIFIKHPQIREIKERLYSLGALYACMSGSGSSVFGIFEREVNIDDEFAGAQKWCGVL